MKSMWPPLAAIFFMSYLYRAVGGHGPSASPLDLLLKVIKKLLSKIQTHCYLFHRKRCSFQHFTVPGLMKSSDFIFQIFLAGDGPHCDLDKHFRCYFEYVGK